MDEPGTVWKLLPRRPTAEEPTALTGRPARPDADRPVMLTRASAWDILALVLELETLATETHAGSASLRLIAGQLTQAVSPTDYHDREMILRWRNAWHEYLNRFRPSDAATQVTERPLSDPEEGA